MRLLFLFLFLISFELLLADGQADKRRDARSRHLRSSPFRKQKKVGDGGWYPQASSDWIPRVCEVLRYDLQLEVNFPFPNYSGRDDFTFQGLLNMTLRITNRTEFIPLRVQNLTLHSAFLQHNGRAAALSSLHVDANSTRAKVIPVDLLVVGDLYSLTINYTGHIASWEDEGLDAFFGIYYDSYKVPDSTDFRYAVTTFLEPSAARKLFPSVDDPHFKSIFSLSLAYPEGAQAVHNSPVLSTDSYPGQKTITRFADTQLTPTYLFSFGVGDFATALNQDSGIPVQAISYPQTAPALQNAANITALCLQSMQSRTNFSFPLSKLDVVGFVQVALRDPMDNFGLVTMDIGSFGTTAFSDDYDQAVQAIVTCQAVAGQWFGGLVTPDRWGTEFLNLGISTFYSAEAAKEQFSATDWDVLEGFVVDERDSAFDVSNYTGLPLVYNESRFDELVELGGSSFLRMVEKVVGNRLFQGAMTIYLDKHQWGTADDRDFIAAFEEAYGSVSLCGDLTITDFLVDWLYRPYFPIVKVSFDPTGGYSFAQRSVNSNDTTQWNIPLFVWSEKTQTVQTMWLLKDGGTCGGIQWDLDDRYLFNYRARAFALFDYSIALWGRMLSIDFTQVDEVTQLGMLIDRRILENQKPYSPDTSMAIKLTEKILNDNNFTASPFIVSYAMEFNQNDTWEDALFQNIDWNPQSIRADVLNDFLLINAVMDDYADHRRVGKEKFDLFMSACADVTKAETCNPIHPNIRGGVYCAGIIDGDQTKVDFFNQYKAFIYSMVPYKPYFSAELFYVEDADGNCQNNGEK